jgi:hypothetical protein
VSILFAAYARKFYSHFSGSICCLFLFRALNLGVIKVWISVSTAYNTGRCYVVAVYHCDTRPSNRPSYCPAHTLPASFPIPHLTFCLHTLDKDSCCKDFLLQSQRLLSENIWLKQSTQETSFKLGLTLRQWRAEKIWNVGSDCFYIVL